jgi:hypothetical protein
MKRDRAAVHEARAEREKSEERLAVTRQSVIGPLSRMHSENHFAEMVKNTLRKEGR